MQKTLSRKSLVIAALSTIVEWYDFTLYLYFVTVLSRVFFGHDEGSLSVSLGGFAIAYLMRPVGALVFGHVGDRHGRRRTMLASMALMTIAMLLTAMLPTRDQAGPIVGVLIILLRCVMGFAVGGEYTAVVAYLLEGAPPSRRGLITSMAAATSEIGALLAAGAVALTVTFVPPAAVETWAWRLPFLFGAAMAGAILLARTTMEESPEFERQQSQGSVPAQPLRQVAKLHRSAIMQGFAISALGSITYYVGITYVPAFLSTAGIHGEHDAAWLATLAAAAVILITPMAGILSDRIGRRAVLVGLAVAGTITPPLMFMMMAQGSLMVAIAGALALAALAGGVSAVGAVASAELFPGEGRLTGLALGVTSATALFGGLTPWLAQTIVTQTGSIIVPGLMIATVSLAVLPIMWRLPSPPQERKPTELV